MNVAKYRKRPVEIEAIQLSTVTINEAADWCHGKVVVSPLGVAIETLEGVMVADLGDYIIKGIAGEFYPCKPMIFDGSYEKVDE